MRRLGQVLHIGSDGSLILKTDGNLKIGSKVVDDKIGEVGVVVDVFGPVNSPYLSVKPEVADGEKLVGKNLVILQHEKVRGKSKR